jgi:phage baseplate assembly protein W
MPNTEPLNPVGTGPFDAEDLATSDSAAEILTPRFNVSDLFPEDAPARESYRSAEQGLEIYSANWQLSATRFGGIVEGSEDLNQAITLALSTRKGSDPFRPTFGSDIWEQVGRPISLAGPAIVRAVRETVGAWEPRVKIVSVSYSYQDSYGGNAGLLSGIRIDITWAPLANGSANQILSLLVADSIGLGDVEDVGIIRILATEAGEAIITGLGEFILV